MKRRARNSNFGIVFLSLYGLSALYILHKMLINYSNSSYVERLTSPEMVGLFYTIGSIGAITMLLLAPQCISKLSARYFILSVVLLEIFALILTGLGLSPFITLTSFIVALVLIPSVGLSVDLLAESVIGDDESRTGTRWALMLSAMSVVSIIATLALARIVGNDPEQLKLMYFLSAGSIALLLLTSTILLRSYPIPLQAPTSLISTLTELQHRSNLGLAYILNLILSLSFAIVSIYLPLYLVGQYDFSWGIIGIMFSVQFSAYLFTEYPIGLLADKKHIERGMLASGFAITILAMIFIAAVSSTSVLFWVGILFLIGIGGSLIETSLMSYIYKRIDASDVHFLSIFRTTTPLAGGVGALLGTALLLFLPFQAIFAALIVPLLIGIFFTLRLTDVL